MTLPQRVDASGDPVCDAELPWSGSDGSDREEFLDLYRQMLEIREFELAIHQLFLQGHVHGTTHLCVGQEAVSVGVCSALEASDFVSATYRGHGHCLAKGLDARALAAELMGRDTGTSRGRAGSMNITDLSKGLVGCFGIVGGSMAAAIGAGLSCLAHEGVSVAFFGDGTANQAYFAECLNFAVVRSLPVIFVCENNLYGEYTPMAAVTAGVEIYQRAGAYGVLAEKIDGNDVRVVHAAAGAAVDRARAGHGPSFIEATTYRHLGHSRSDPATYRPAEEVTEWLARDPIPRARRQLIDVLSVAETEIDAVDERVKIEIEAAMSTALAAPYPSPELA
jgi:TPP-dependent pyruvate/acetoin dehydrogenase alpha subunit